MKLHGIPTHFLTDYGLEFTTKFFCSICRYLSVKLLTTTAYHLHGNVRTERDNMTIIARLQHYVAENHADWNEYVQPLTYVYNTQVRRSTKFTPFYVVLSRKTAGPVMLMAPSLRDMDVVQNLKTD